MARNPIRPPGDDLAVRFSEIERRLRALESATPGGFSGDGETTFLRDRDLRIIGGTVRVEANGDIVIDGGQLVAGPTTVDASGLQVGPDVVIDSSGLHVAGGLVQSIWFDANRSFQTDNSLTTTYSTIATININPPSWVEVLAIEAVGNGSMTNNSGSTQRLQYRVTIQGTNPAVRSNHVENATTRTHSAFASETVTLSPPGQSLDVTFEARLDSGTNSTNALSLNVSAFGVRTAFS